MEPSLEAESTGLREVARGMSASSDTLMQAAADVARLAGERALRHWRTRLADERFTAHPARRAGWDRLASRAGLVRSWGDCYGYLLVATGRAEVMVDPALAAWDSAALLPIVEEAGGVFTDWSGARTAFGGSAI